MGLRELFQRIANAIRSKTGSDVAIKATDFPQAIENIETTPEGWHDTSEVDATAADVLSPKKIVDENGNVLTGSIPTRGAGIYFAELNNDQVIETAGKYCNGDITLKGITIENLTEGNIRSGVTVRVISGGTAIKTVAGTLASPNSYSEWGSTRTVADHTFGHYMGGTTIASEIRKAYEYTVPAGKTPKALLWKSNFIASDLFAVGCAWNLNSATSGQVNNAYGNNGILEAASFINSARTKVYVPSDGTTYFCVIFV